MSVAIGIVLALIIIGLALEISIFLTAHRAKKQIEELKEELRRYNHDLDDDWPTDVEF